ncbi:unnamed protein product, partial [Rotaria sp. Silwood1]
MSDENEGVEILETTELSPIPTAELTEFGFLKEYKPDKSKATCMACNSQFSVHYGGKTDVVQHSKSKQRKRNMLTFSVDRQLITISMKPTEIYNVFLSKPELLKLIH